MWKIIDILHEHKFCNIFDIRLNFFFNIHSSEVKQWNFLGSHRLFCLYDASCLSPAPYTTYCQLCIYIINGTTSTNITIYLFRTLNTNVQLSYNIFYIKIMEKAK